MLAELEEEALRLPLACDAAGLPTAEGAAMLRGALERYLMGALHSKVLGVGHDAVEDKVFSAQIGTLAFVSPPDLGLDDGCCRGERWEAATVRLREGG